MADKKACYFLRPHCCCAEEARRGLSAHILAAQSGRILGSVGIGGPKEGFSRLFLPQARAARYALAATTATITLIALKA